MNPHNDEQDALNNISNIRREILQLCNAPGSKTNDFHRLGFSCLLRKLHEIEKIINGLKDMPRDVQSPPHINRCQPVVTEPEPSIHQCYQEERINPTILSLPDDLTPHTKQVLLDIYHKIERSFDEFYEDTKSRLKQSFEDCYRKFESFMSTLREKQKTEVRIFIENILVNDNLHETISDTLSGDISHAPTLAPPIQTSEPTQLPSNDAPLINMNAVRQTLECPGIDPQLKRQFFANLNGLNDILNEIMEQVDRRRQQTPREPPSNPPSIPEVSSQCELDETRFQPYLCNR